MNYRFRSWESSDQGREAKVVELIPIMKVLRGILQAQFTQKSELLCI